MISQKKRQLKSVEKKIEAIKAAFPNVNFMDMEIKSAYEKFHALTKQLIYLKVDIICCNSEKRVDMCDGCNCWKATANRCS